MIVRNERHARPGVELYNLSEDLAQKNKLAEVQPEMVKAMQVKPEAWKEEVTAGVK
ncbi:MAG TPA: hypothetical protein VMX13_03505 [Sedimentisphaerales bacterium]|nr:hypothetical protein [Sedimentisphaerales bacterium]